MSDSKYHLEARSKNDGIVFYSKTVRGLGLEAFYDEEEQIQFKTIYTEVDEFNDYLGMMYFSNSKKFTNKHIITLTGLMFILNIILTILFDNFGFFSSAIIFAMMSDKIFNFINTSYAIKSKKGKDYELGSFHAAEHMTCNAYEKLQRIPTLKETLSFSRFHKRCGSKSTISNFFFLITSILFFPLLFVTPQNLIILLLLILLYILNQKFNVLRFLQILIINQATEKELFLAIKGLEEYEKMETIAKNDLSKLNITAPHDFKRIFKSNP